MQKNLRPDEPTKLPTARPNNIGIMVRFAVIAAAVLVLLAFALNR